MLEINLEHFFRSRRSHDRIWWKLALQLKYLFCFRENIKITYNIYVLPIVNLINLSHTVRACLIWLTDYDCFHEVQNHVVILLLNSVKWVLPLKICMGNTWCTIDIQCMIYCVCKWRLHCLFQCTYIIWDVYYPLCYFVLCRGSGVN